MLMMKAMPSVEFGSIHTLPSVFVKLKPNACNTCKEHNHYNGLKCPSVKCIVYKLAQYLPNYQL